MEMIGTEQERAFEESKCTLCTLLYQTPDPGPVMPCPIQWGQCCIKFQMDMSNQQR